jgi:proteasome lid subunit RPN8/RPN11
MEGKGSSQYVLKIDARAYSVALGIARLAGEQECMFLLLGEPGTNVVRHVLLLPGQQVSPCSCAITAQGMAQALEEIAQLNHVHEPKWVVLGWGHSHGHLDVFHSATDVSTSDDVTLQIGFANRWVREEPLAVRRDAGGELHIALHGEEDEVVLHPAGSACAPQTFQATRCISVGFAYSLVVNARGDTYAEVMTIPLDAPPGKACVQRHPATLCVLPEPLDEAALRAEIGRKLNCAVAPPPVALLPAPRWWHRLLRWGGVRHD